jgi:hypothetical protein
MRRDDDKKAIGIWLDCYNKLKGTSYRVCSYPDEQDRNSASIDALCKNSEGGTLGLEHTRIEAFPGEMTDNARFMEVLGKLENDPSLAEIGVQTRASIEVGAIPKGVSWSTLRDDLEAFIKLHIFGLAMGAHTLVFAQGSISIPLRIDKRIHKPGRPGSFLVARRWPGEGNESTLRKAFDDKLPKLKAFAAGRKILLLEQNSVAGTVSSDVDKYFASHGPPAWMPDELWMLFTAALETEEYMHVHELYPNSGNLLADWSNGKITSNYP